MTDARCSDASREAGEPLAATATTTEHWLLVEVRGGWPRDVGKSEALPEAARRAVAGWLAGTPRSRLLFVRRPSRTTATVAVFVVHASESGGTVHRLDLGGLDDLADVDLAVDGELADAPLVLVCGHGNRDACCARRGTAVFGALTGALGEEELWLSSHQGGHRFAANVLVLPAAIQLGRVEPEEAARVVGDVLRGRIDLRHFRGRPFYDSVVQAADHAVRESTALDGLDDVRLVHVAGRVVRLRGADGVEHVVEVSETSGPTVPVGCGLDPEQQTVLRGRLVAA